MLKRTISLMLIAAILLCSMLTGVITAFAEVSENALDAAFESYLDAEGFPESYRPMLRELHAKYPNWKFKALKVNINFATVVSAEYILISRNLSHLMVKPTTLHHMNILLTVLTRVISSPIPAYLCFSWQRVRQGKRLRE